MERWLKNIRYWFSINHIERIKTYSFLTHLHYVFNFNVSGIVVNLQADFSDLPPLICPKGYLVREMDTNNPDEIADRIRIVNQSYYDAEENDKSFIKHLNKHPFLDVKKIFFITRNGQAVGTVITGLYRNNPQYGGCARLAILPSEQGNGLGVFVINYASYYLYNQGIRLGETIITLKRKQSLLLHFKLGFKPQFSRNKINFDIQKRMWPARMIARLKVYNLYEKYLKLTIQNQHTQSTK